MQGKPERNVLESEKKKSRKKHQENDGAANDPAPTKAETVEVGIHKRSTGGSLADGPWRKEGKKGWNAGKS